jgi:hypothetical protein
MIITKPRDFARIKDNLDGVHAHRVFVMAAASAPRSPRPAASRRCST